MRVLRHRRQRGWVLLLVLMITAVMLVTVSAIYSEAEASLATSYAITGQQMATSRAQMGIEVALARLRKVDYDTIQVPNMHPCYLPSYNYDPEQCPPALEIVGPVDCTWFTPACADATVPLVQGGGLQYKYVVYMREIDPTTGRIPSGSVITVRSTGYYGYSLVDPRLVTSVIEADVKPGQGAGVRCGIQDNTSC